MNIVVLTASGKVIVRPDTTWERDNEDAFLPEFVSAVTCSPVLTARVCKPGRSVGVKFAERYYDCVGSGVLLYPENLMDGSAEGYACASCLDHTSFIPMPTGSKESIDGASIKLSADGMELVCINGLDRQAICRAIAEVTRFCYIRIGDIIAVELGDRKPLALQCPGRMHIAADGLGEASDFNVIL